MRRILFLACVAAALSPQLAMAWSVQSGGSGQDSSKFTDQDEQLQHMAGRDEYGNSTSANGFGSSQSVGGMTFSATSQNSAPSVPVFIAPPLSATRH